MGAEEEKTLGIGNREAGVEVAVGEVLVDCVGGVEVDSWAMMLDLVVCGRWW